MTQEEIEPGICKECGCTWTTPCVDQKFGPCWWMDKNQDLCSSLSELSKSQYYLLKQTDAKMSDFEDFLDDVKGSVVIFKKE